MTFLSRMLLGIEKSYPKGLDPKEKKSNRELEKRFAHVYLKMLGAVEKNNANFSAVDLPLEGNEESLC